MPFNEIERDRIKKVVGKFCQERIPEHLRNQIKLICETRGFDVKIIECRPYFQNSHEWTESPIARLKYDPKTSTWQLYWMRASGRWWRYPDSEPTHSLENLIDEIRRDPHHVFWG
jgi:hypothetical protein